MDNRLHILNLGVILISLLMVQCQSSEQPIQAYTHDQVYVDMMVDLTIANKIQSKVLYSQRDLTMDTILDQVEQIHGRSIQDFNTYLLQVKSNDKAYTEFLDSVKVAKERLRAQLMSDQDEE